MNYFSAVNRHTDEIVCALRAPALIDGGYASSNLLSWVVTAKYLDHLPLYRLEQIAEREGVTLSRSTLANCKLSFPPGLLNHYNV